MLVYWAAVDIPILYGQKWLATTDFVPWEVRSSCLLMSVSLLLSKRKCLQEVVLERFGVVTDVLAGIFADYRNCHTSQQPILMLRKDPFTLPDVAFRHRVLLESISVTLKTSVC